jgi:hypothetical protein
MHLNAKVSSYFILKLISTILFIFILLALILIKQNPAAGYELSIYSSLPVTVWLLLLGAIIGGIVLVVNQAENSSGKKARYCWQIGLLLILLSNLAIVLLPYLRGYAFSCSGDHLSHLGYVKDILQTGTLTTRNVYPITHITISQLSSILGISEEIVINFIGPLFYLLFVLFTYLLSREILPKTAAILATTASTVLYCYYYNQVFPMGFAFITTVLVFYLYFKYLNHKSVAFATILIVTGCSIVFFHPVTSFMLIVALVVMESGKIIFDRIFITGRGRISLVNQISLILPILFFVIFMMWIWAKYWVWNSSVSSVAGWFNAELFTKPMSEIAFESFDKLGLSTLGILELFIRMYGHYFIYLVLSLIAIESIVRKCFISFSGDNHNIFLYSILFMPMTAIWLTDYIRPLTTFSSGRIIWFMTALFPSLVGLGLYRIGRMETERIGKDTMGGFSTDKGKTIGALSVIFILIICSVIGIFSIYPSPLTSRTNWASSYAMSDGQEWLLENGDPNVKVLTLGSQAPHRYANALWGTTARDYPGADKNEEQFPDHFNYHLGYTTFGQSIEGNRYIILRQNHIILLYKELYTTMGIFNDDDFFRFKLDPSVNKLCTNEDTQILYVH